MSFGLSREECAQLVAREGYEKHCREDNQRHSAWENLPHDARERWLDFGRHVMAMVGPSIALDTLLDAKAQIVFKTPEPDPAYVQEAEKTANDWVWATASASYKQGYREASQAVEEQLEKFAALADNEGDRGEFKDPAFFKGWVEGMQIALCTVRGLRDRAVSGKSDLRPNAVCQCRCACGA